MRRPTELSEPQFRMLVVRLLEAAVLLLLAVTVLELWVGYTIAGQQPNPATGEMQPGVFSWGRLAEAVGFFAFRGPISVMVAAGLMVGIAAVLAGGRPVANAEALRREAAVLGGGTALFTLFHLGAGAAWLAMTEPDQNSPFDSRLQQSGSLFWPLVGLVLVALFFLWWTRLARHAEDGDADAGAAEQRPRGTGEVEDPAGGPDEQAMIKGFADAEQITPADRPPRDEPLSPDGSTTNGYDEFFRRR